MRRLFLMLVRFEITEVSKRIDIIMRIIALGLYFCLFNPMSVFSNETKLLKFGKLVDGTGAVLNNVWILVEKDRIQKVTAEKFDDSIIRKAELIDLSSYTGIPGLIDVHTHMTYYWDQTPGTDPWKQGDERSPSMTVYLAQENALKMLNTGVTTVRDLGAFDPNSCDRMDIAMRDLINLGAMIGPRMFVCGYALLPSVFVPQTGYPTPVWGQADGVDEIIRVVRREVAAGADVIKMFASTGSADDVSGHQIYTFEEIKAAVEVTQSLGKRIAVHSYGPEAAHDAITAGANSIEHATDLDDETIQEMVRRGTFYVPTIDHNRYYVEHAEEYGYGQDVIDKLNAFIERNLETARRAHKAGVRFAMGSDALFTMFGENTRELGWFVKAGMTPEQALKTATTNAAELLGMKNELGKIKHGYYADIVAVEGDPLQNIDVVIQNVKWVMKAGKVVVDKTDLSK